VRPVLSGVTFSYMNVKLPKIDVIKDLHEKKRNIWVCGTYPVSYNTTCIVADTGRALKVHSK
jgi:hypothetical protein